MSNNVSHSEAQDKILVIKRDILESMGCSEGFSSNVDLLPLLMSKAFFRKRFLVENDSLLKQLIPYAVLVNQSMILTYDRQRGSEPRLESFSSFGFGGHVTQNDLSEDRKIDVRIIWNALRREITEEIGIYIDESYEPIGLVNEDFTPIGKLHLGIVYAISAKADFPFLHTHEARNFRWVSKEKVCEVKNLESWSAILAKKIDVIIDGIVKCAD